MAPPYPQPITILNGLTAAATPPTYNSGNGWGLVPTSWRGGGVNECDVVVHAAGANEVTVAKLLAGSLESQVLADDDVDTVDTTDNELDIASHAYVTGDGPVRLTTTGTLPGGLAINTDYWVIVVGSGAISLAESFEFAMLNKKIDLTAGSSGTHTIVDVAASATVIGTRRIKWLSLGFLGEAADGAMTLTATTGWRGRVKHSQETVVYSVGATFGSAVATTVRLEPKPLLGA